MIGSAVITGCLKAVAGVGLGEALAFLDGHQLELGLLVDVEPGVRVIPTVPYDIRSTGKAGDVPGTTTESDAKDGIDGDDLNTEPGLEEGRSLLGGVSGSSGHGDGYCTGG